MIAKSKRLPERTRKPARSCSGSSWAVIISRSLLSRPATLSASDLPVTVIVPPSILPDCSSSLTTAGTPPARWNLSPRYSRRLHVDEQGHVVAVLPIGGLDGHSGVTCHGHDVWLGVGGPAKGRGCDDRVQEGFAGQDLRRTQILVGHLGDALPRVVGHLAALAVGRGDGRAPWQ